MKTASRHTRSGTAQRDIGKATALKLVKTAYDMLMEGGYADFSMRSIANTAGVRLANLQYYFPKKEDLILALMHYVGEVYDNRYREYLEKAGSLPLDQFKAAILFNLDDIFCIKTRHFFIQFWPLLAMVDNYSGKLLNKFYQPQLRQFETLIGKLHPSLEKSEVQQRAEMITALIEGSMVVTLPPKKKDEASFRQYMLQQSLNIASDTHLNKKST